MRASSRIIGTKGSSSNIVTSGLILNLDAGNTSSYPGSGTTWFDISGNGNNGTLSGPTYSSLNSGSLIYTNSSITTVPMLNLRPTSGITQESWFLTTNNTAQVLIGAQWGTGGDNSYAIWINAANQWASGVRVSGAFNFQTHNATINTNIWYHITHTYDGSNQIFYINGISALSWSSTGSIQYDTNNTLLAVGNDWNGSGYNVGAAVGIIGRLGITRIYNRALSAIEISQNFNALRSRYGV